MSKLVQSPHVTDCLFVETYEWVKCLEQERGPGHEPDEAEAPEEPEGGGVVVVGDAEVEVAEEVLVHEVEPEPAANVAVGGEGDLPVVVDEVEGGGVALGGVGEAGEDVPGGGDGQEEEDGGGEVELAEAEEGVLEASGEEEVDEGDGHGEDEADEALGEDVEGAGDGEAAGVAAVARAARLSTALRSGRDDSVLAGVFGAVEAVEGEGGPEADHGVGDGDAGEEEDAEAGEGDEGGVEAGVGAGEEAAGEGFGEEGEGEDGEGERNAGGDGESLWAGGAEELRDAHGGGHGPVEERGLLEVADAVGVEGDVVVAEEHLAGDFGVDAVGVVEQRGRDEGEAGVEGDPEQEDAEERGAGAGRGG